MKFNFALCALACAALTACGTTKQLVTANATASTATIEQQRNVLLSSIRDSEVQRVAQQEVRRPFIAGRTQPLARDISMPEKLRQPTKVTALFQRAPVDLATAARQISEATGLMITVTPDALLPPASFGPKTGPTTVVTTSPVAAPPMVVVNAQGVPIWQLLDDVARQVNASWRPTSSGAEIYRVETRVFQLSAISQMANTSASLGRNGGNNAVFESQSKTSFESKNQNLVTGIKTAVEALLTLGGRAVLSEESQSLVVTDTPQNMERIAAYITAQNKSMSRRVRVLIEAIEVISKDSSEQGIDWNLLYNTANAAANTLATSTPAQSLTGSTVGSMTVVARTGALAGSSLVVKALSDVGTIVSRRSFPFITTNGRPVTQALRSTFNYVDQVQATTLASSTSNVVAQAPTVNQKDETVGTFVTLVPTAKDDGTIFLSVSFDVTSAQPLTPFVVGAGTSAITVQQKVIDGTGVIQEVPVRSGQTVVIGGIDLSTGQDNERRLGKGAPMLLGGSDKTSAQHTQMVLLVTAVAEEGI